MNFSIHYLENGSWSEWSTFSTCKPKNKYCGDGSKTHYRNCTNPPPSNGGLECSGPSNETVYCRETLCGKINNLASCNDKL